MLTKDEPGIGQIVEAINVPTELDLFDRLKRQQAATCERREFFQKGVYIRKETSESSSTQRRFHKRMPCLEQQEWVRAGKTFPGEN